MLVSIEYFGTVMEKLISRDVAETIVRTSDDDGRPAAGFHDRWLDFPTVFRDYDLGSTGISYAAWFRFFWYNTA